MMCDPCFMDANQVGFVHELSWEDIQTLLDNAISIKPRRQMSVQFSGGEPTLSPYFLDAVRFFFFSSRRRHTRWTGDWSSDVCSSDLRRRRPRPVRSAARRRGRRMTRVLVARQDNLGDVLLAGPCVRAVAARASHVTLLAGPHGRAAAELLPGVDEVLTWTAPWIDPEPPPVTAEDTGEFVALIRSKAFDRALILTSFHQSPLPLALLLRQAGVPWIGAISEDYPGSLLDLRHRVDGDPPEPVRMLSLAEAAGYALPPDDHGALALRRPLPPITRLTGGGPYVVVHPA